MFSGRWCYSTSFGFLLPARPLAIFENLQFAPSTNSASVVRVADALIVAAHASGVAGGLLLLVFLILLVLPPGAPGWWVPLLRGVVGFVGIVAVVPGARVEGTAMAAGTRVTDFCCCCRPVPCGHCSWEAGIVCYTFSAVTGCLELQAKPPRPGP